MAALALSRPSAECCVQEAPQQCCQHTLKVQGVFGFIIKPCYVVYNNNNNSNNNNNKNSNNNNNTDNNNNNNNNYNK